MGSGVSRTSSAVPTQQTQTAEKPRDADTANKFKESLGKSDSFDGSTSSATLDKGAGESVSRYDDGGRNQMRFQRGDSGRVDSDGGRGRQGQSDGGDKGDKGGKDGQKQPSRPMPGAADPRMTPRQTGQPRPTPGMKQQAPRVKGQGPPPGELSRGMVGTGKMGKQPAGTAVRGTSPFLTQDGMAKLLGGNQKPPLRHTRQVGSRGMPSHRLQQGVQTQDPRFRASISTMEHGPRTPGKPLRTPPPSAGAPLVGSGAKKGTDKMPEIGGQGHSNRGVNAGIDDVGRVDREGGEQVRDIREREIKAPEIAPKPTVELQQRPVEVKSVQQTQKMTQAEMAELVRKVESMVSKVRLETTIGGDKQMAMTISDGRLKGVEINVSVDKSGKINAEFKAENVDARNVLSEGMKELEKSLQSKGLEVNKLEIGSESTGRRDFSSQQEQQQKHESAQRTLEQMEEAGILGQGTKDPRLGAPKPTQRPATTAPAGTPAGAVPTDLRGVQGDSSANYTA